MEGLIMTLEIGHFLNKAIKMLIAEGKVGKVADFAVHCNISENVIVNIINNRKTPSWGEWLTITQKLKELSPDYSYKYLHDQVFMWEKEK